MKIGILYNLAELREDNKNKENKGAGKKIDELAHNEVLFTSNCIKEALSKKRHDVSLIKVREGIFGGLNKNFDFIFNLAEDVQGDVVTESRIPAELDRIGIPYSGSDEDALSLSLEKENTKKLLSQNKIPTPNFQVFHSFEAFEEAEEEAENLTNLYLNPRLNFPLIVKPAHAGGSIGIGADSIVKNKIELGSKLREITKVYKQPALVEEYIEGREINAALLGNGEDVKVLPLSEIVFDYPRGIPKILTYESKWVEGDELYRKSNGKCPAELDNKTREKIEAISKKAFSIIGCRDYARVDFRLKEGIPYVLEVNANPCLNPDGGFIRSAKAAGYSYDGIIYEIFKSSIERHRTDSR